MTHPSGPAGTHPPYRSAARDLFEGALLGLSLAFAVWTMAAITPSLTVLWAGLAGFGFVAYVAYRIVRTRGMS